MNEKDQEAEIRYLRESLETTCIRLKECRALLSASKGILDSIKDTYPHATEERRDAMLKYLSKIKELDL